MKKRKQLTTYREDIFDFGLYAITKTKLDKFTCNYLRKLVQDPLWRGIGFRKAKLYGKLFRSGD